MRNNEFKYPLSLKVALVLLGITLIISLFVIPSNSSNEGKGENILPDMELPWNKSEDALVQTLNNIYQYADLPWHPATHLDLFLMKENSLVTSLNLVKQNMQHWYIPLILSIQKEMLGVVL